MKSSPLIVIHYCTLILNIYSYTSNIVMFKNPQGIEKYQLDNIQSRSLLWFLTLLSHEISFSW